MGGTADVDLYGWRPEAVVFDCDGLLVDTEPCWSVAEAELFARRGLPFGIEEKALVIGKSLPGAAAVLVGVFDEPGRAVEIADELLTLVAEVVAAEAEAKPGAGALVELVAAAGLPFGVASNSPRALLESALQRGGFAGAFPYSVAADEVEHPKPAPDMYEIACAALGVAPADTLAFEDSLTGLASAQAAGVRVVGVPTLRGQAFPADHVVASLLDTDLVAWVRGWKPV
ncbi:HAD family hydrolase [Pseudonocardia sp. TRM90224]|uniref:HAD family hydrolase n=1 Tax=Pseudonocardia sp. TRM90224 TaxID=2812678 RepID=UPI001E422B57|nr:HAD family phosphatase [Pseudonocardia sp. TRM90224]